MKEHRCYRRTKIEPLFGVMWSKAERSDTEAFQVPCCHRLASPSHTTYSAALPSLAFCSWVELCWTSAWTAVFLIRRGDWRNLTILTKAAFAWGHLRHIWPSKMAQIRACLRNIFLFSLVFLSQWECRTAKRTPIFLGFRCIYYKQQLKSIQEEMVREWREKGKGKNGRRQCMGLRLFLHPMSQRNAIMNLDDSGFSARWQCYDIPWRKTSLCNRCLSLLC